MLDINLLPPVEQRIVRMEIRRRLVRFVAAIFSGMFVVGSILLLPALFPLLLEQRELKRAALVESEAATLLGVEETVSRITAIAASLNRANRSLMRAARASALMDELWRAAGSDVALLNFEAGAGGAFMLRGVAATRVSLLQFEAALRGSGLFEEIEFPLSNIVSSADVQFSLNGVLRTDARL